MIKGVEYQEPYEIENETIFPYCSKDGNVYEESSEGYQHCLRGGNIFHTLEEATTNFHKSGSQGSNHHIHGRKDPINLDLSDPDFENQWFLHDRLGSGGDLNVMALWGLGMFSS